MSAKKLTTLTEKKKISGEFPKDIKEEDTQLTGEIEEDELGLIVGGTSESAIEFLERYTQGIPIDRQRKEAEEILKELKGEAE
jgi:hypothetical protein